MDFKKFFAELKRRKVYNVAVTYAVVSWVISQIITQLTTTFEAPLWVAKMMTLVLIAGFPIAIILAWAFEMSPEGMIKTSSEAAKKNPYPPNKKKPLSGKLFIGVLILIIIGQFAYHKYQQNYDEFKNNKEVSIAVLPLKYISQHADKEYLASGAADAIRGHLSKIKGLRVIPKTSVEQYNGTKKTASIIGDELDVTYLLEGSFSMVDNQVVLSINLVLTDEEDNIFYNEYNRDYSEIQKVQREVAKKIANEISIEISPDAMERIDAIPTDNPEAYDHYLRGNEIYFKANNVSQKNEEWTKQLDRATLEYNKAIETDPSFAQAYVGLALVDYKRNVHADILQKGYLENVLRMADKALSLDPNLADAYSVRGLYYFNIYKPKKALLDCKKALDIDPNNIESMYNLSILYRLFDLNFIESIKVLQRVEDLVHSQDDLWRLNAEFVEYYRQLDDLEGEEYHLKKQRDFKPDAIVNFWYLFTRTNRKNECLDYIESRQKDTNQYRVVSLAGCYYFGGDFENAVKYYAQMEDLVLKEDFNYGVSIRDFHRYGHSLIKTGNREKGMKMIQHQIDINKGLIKLKRPDYGLIYDLVGIYFYLEDREEAKRWMDIFSDGEGWLKFGSVYSLVQVDPLFDAVRNDPIFTDWVETGGKKQQAARNQIHNYLEK